MVNSHDQLQIMLADVIAMVEDVITTQGVCVILAGVIAMSG